MIAHVVLFKPQSTLVTDQKLAILQTLMASLKQCPTVRGCRIGHRVLHGLPGYEQAMHDDYEYALLLEFDDVQGLKDYLQHPAHAQLGQIFSGSASSALAYDYQMATLDAAERML
jgi:hypothetical protein